MSARVLLPHLRDRVKTDGVGGGWVNPLTGQGGPMDRHNATTFEASVPLDSGQVDALMENSGLSRKIVWRMVDDAMRPGFGLSSEALDADPVLAQRCVDWLRRRGVLSAVKQAKASARATGGGMILVVAAGSGQLDQPLDRASMQGVARLVVRDRFEATPLSRLDLDPLSPWYGQAEYWHVRGQTRDHRVHASRLIRFDGEPISDRARQRRHGWGASVLDLLFAELRNLGIVGDSAAEAVTLLTQGVFKMPGYLEAMASNNAEKIASRWRAIRAGLGTLGDIVLDGTEEYEIKSRTFAGMGDIREIVEAALVRASPYPRLILLGETTPGLSGEASGEIRAYYDAVAASREDEYEPPLLELVQLMLSDPRSPLGGLVPPDLGITWPDLWQLSPAERADLGLKAAQRRALDAKILTPAELRSDSQLAEVYDLDELADVAPQPEQASDAIAPTVELPVDGEGLIEISAAARQMGYRTSTPLLRLVRSGAVRHWRAPGGRVRVLWSEVVAATRGTVH